MTGPGVLPLPGARVAVLCGVAVQPHPTVRSVAEYAGLAYGTARYHLAILRDAGLVTWEPCCAGTLRPTFRLVPVSPSAHVGR